MTTFDNKTNQIRWGNQEIRSDNDNLARKIDNVSTEMQNQLNATKHHLENKIVNATEHLETQISSTARNLDKNIDNNNQLATQRELSEIKRRMEECEKQWNQHVEELDN